MESIYANVSRGDISKFFKLCLDVARWYAAHNTSQMRYQAETKRFWTIGYKLFCEKFVRYMEWLQKCWPSTGIKYERGAFALPISYQLRCTPGGCMGGGMQLCSCGSESPTLNKGKLLVKSRPLFRDTNHYLVLFMYTLN